MTRPIVDDSSDTLRELLKTYRVRAGLTQEELSDRSGISVRAISDMERGTAKSPQRRTIESLAPPLALTDEELTRLQKVAKQARTRPVSYSTSTTTSRTPSPSIGDPLLLGMLPPDLNDFTGREHALDELSAIAAELTDPSRRSGRYVVLSGPPGTGKTSLAVRAARDLAAEFPDGCHFLKLRGMSAQPNPPSEVLHLLLRSLGINAAHIPAEPEQRASLCRSLLQDRRSLIVLDDAADEAQVRQLLAGGPRCLTVITSRHLLVGLHGVQRISLDVLDHDDAVALLSSVIGPTRVAQERAAASELVELCGRLPLAIRIIGNRLASRPVWPLTHLIGQLRDQSRRLTALTAGDLDVRSVFDLSYRQLSPNAATAFRRLSLVPAADFSAGAAMALIDAPEEDDAAILLEELADASLLQPSQPYGRYQFHDLLRVFAGERLAQEETPDAVAEAENRLVDWLMRTATAAGCYFAPTDGVVVPPAATPSFSDHLGAGRWLEEEAQNWLAAVKSSFDRGEHQKVLDLAAVMHWYAELGGTETVWDLLDVAVRSAVATDHRFYEAVHRHYLSWVRRSQMGLDTHEAVELSQQAIDAAAAQGNAVHEAWARVYLANTKLSSGTPVDYPELMGEAVRLFEQADYRLGVNLARFMLAGYLHEIGRTEEAAEQYAVCLQYFEHPYDGRKTPSDDINYANLLLRSSHNLAALDQVDRALGQLDMALDLFERHGGTMGRARTLQASGQFLRQKGELRQAHARLAEALDLFERAGLPQSQVEVLAEMAELSDQLRDPVAARGERERAMSLCDRLDPAEAAKLRKNLTEQLNAS
ncbi:NB-ARC domain-containing protein [Nocardia sp. NRRL S-836]|uniref:ATP-binding protein n=1 Tax=Nocardia sp. NRRL S-836 TaxID=1519492 RepID=UPI0006AF2023|nr:XRE family transcriptional regulator [Nocardia sp. NRRL S-836]KOV86340.1 XRE family transcriptional regulator [Nocardia sp. NRRL S-836]